MIGNVIGTIICDAFLAALSFYVARTWMRWSRNDPRPARPQWRSGITAVGFAASTVSLAVIVSLAIHALITGGLRYYHPVLLFAARFGFVAALLGIVAALIGSGQLEVPTIVCSGLCLLIWFVEGVAS
jgi:hypothetical protein